MSCYVEIFLGLLVVCLRKYRRNKKLNNFCYEGCMRYLSIPWWSSRRLDICRLKWKWKRTYVAVRTSTWTIIEKKGRKSWIKLENGFKTKTNEALNPILILFTVAFPKIMLGTRERDSERIIEGLGLRKGRGAGRQWVFQAPAASLADQRGRGDMNSLLGFVGPRGC